MIIIIIFRFFNENGSQYEDENPYKILRDSIEQPGYFPECSAYVSSTDFKINPKYEIYNEDLMSDFVLIKRLVYEKGPMIAMLESKIL